MNTKLFNINFSSCQKRNNGGGSGSKGNGHTYSIPGYYCQGCGCKTDSVYCYACQ